MMVRSLPCQWSLARPVVYSAGCCSATSSGRRLYTVLTLQGGEVAKNIVLCLDGTNNKLRSAANTNVVRMFDLLDLRDASRQVAYYSPGVGTFSSPAAWTPVARSVSRYSGLAFGAGLRENLGGAYRYLMSVHEPGDRLFFFGFSRGAYTARALTGMLEVFGLFRRGSENL